MRTARYWSRATVTIDGVEDPNGGVVGLGWSDVGEPEARRVALERAKRAAARLRDYGDPAGEYPYPDRPVCEPVIDELRGGDRVIAAITRNAQGALVMNTADVMFIDIDRTYSKAGCLVGFATSGKQDDTVAKTAERLGALADRDSRLCFRLYRTAGGLRVLVTGRTFDPASDESAELMNSLDADSRYVLLCKTQSCYRARLTPKPWRCGVTRAPRNFPYETDEQRTAFESWLEAYTQASNQYAVCELIEEIGQQRVDDIVRPVLVMHDELTCCQGMPLA